MMNREKHLAFNFSNQGNLCNVQKTTLCQYNLGIVLGLGYLNRGSFLEPSLEKIPVNISVDKTGEVEINGIKDKGPDNVRIYTDKKITRGQ